MDSLIKMDFTGILAVLVFFEIIYISIKGKRKEGIISDIM